MVDVMANAMQSEALFDGGKGRVRVWGYSTTKTRLKATTCVEYTCNTAEEEE